MVRNQPHKVAMYSLSSELTSQDTLSDVAHPSRPGTQSATEVQLGTLMAQMPALLWTTDLELNVTQILGNGLGHWQSNPRHMAGMPLGDLFPTEAVRMPVLTAHYGALGGHSQTFEFELDEAVFSGSVEPLFNADRSLVGTVAVAVDITERKIAETERLQQISRNHAAEQRQSLMRLAGGMAHHFNNLLTGVLGYTSLARGTLTLDHPVQPMLGEVEKAATCLADLTEQLLLFGQRRPTTMGTVNLSRLIREHYATMQAMLSETITLRYDLMDDVPVIAADPESLRRLFSCLLSHASEAIGDGTGVVIMRTQVINGPPREIFADVIGTELRDSTFVWLQVSDTGCGMDEDTRKHIFEPFPQGANSRRSVGLAAALGIVLAHHGAMAVSSKPGLGTTCHVFFPLHTSGADAEIGPEGFI